MSAEGDVRRTDGPTSTTARATIGLRQKRVECDKADSDRYLGRPAGLWRSWKLPASDDIEARLFGVPANRIGEVAYFALGRDVRFRRGEVGDQYRRRLPTGNQRRLLGFSASRGRFFAPCYRVISIVKQFGSKMVASAAPTGPRNERRLICGPVS